MIAITSGLRNMQQVLDLAWEKLLPAMQSSLLPAAAETNEKLAKRLQTLAVRLPEASGQPIDPPAKSYVFPENEQKLETITLERDPADGHATLSVRLDGVEQRIVCGNGKWIDGEAAWGCWPSSRLRRRVPGPATDISQSYASSRRPSSPRYVCNSRVMKSRSIPK